MAQSTITKTKASKGKPTVVAVAPAPAAPKLTVLFMALIALEGIDTTFYKATVKQDGEVVKIWNKTSVTASRSDFKMLIEKSVKQIESSGGKGWKEEGNSDFYQAEQDGAIVATWNGGEKYKWLADMDEDEINKVSKPKAAPFTLDESLREAVDKIASTSDKIRFLSNAGLTVSQISKGLPAHYGFTFNVVKNLNEGKTGKPRSKKFTFKLTEKEAQALDVLLNAHLKDNVDAAVALAEFEGKLKEALAPATA